ncbi:MAG: hypothetical protein ACFFD4_04150 [Candidatus Odinarchaeota archaeon]
MKAEYKAIIIVLVLNMLFLVAIAKNSSNETITENFTRNSELKDKFSPKISENSGTVSNKRLIHIEEREEIYLILTDWESYGPCLYKMNYDWIAFRQKYGEGYYRYNDLCYDSENSRIYIIGPNFIHVYDVITGEFVSSYDSEDFSPLGDYDLTKCHFSGGNLYIGTESAHVLILFLSDLTMQDIVLEEGSPRYLLYSFTTAITESNDDIIFGTDDGLVLINKESLTKRFIYRFDAAITERVTTLAISGNIVYVGTEDGIYTLDPGTLLTQEFSIRWYPNEDLYARITTIYIPANDGIYIGTYNFLYHFVDGSTITERCYSARSMIWVESKQVYFLATDYGYFEVPSIADSNLYNDLKYVEILYVNPSTATSSQQQVNYYKSGIWPLLFFLAGMMSLGFVFYRVKTR